MNENISGFWDNLAEGRIPKFLSADLEFFNFKPFEIMILSNQNQGKVEVVQNPYILRALAIHNN